MGGVSWQNAGSPFEVRPMSVPEAQRWVHAWPTHVLSVVDEAAQAVTSSRADLTAGVVTFEDVCDPSHPAAATPGHVERIAAFGASIPAGARVLVHCRGGIGRSPAAAVVIMVAAGVAPAAALDVVAGVRRQARPNPWVLLLADELLTPDDHALWDAWMRWARPRDGWVPVDAAAREVPARMSRRRRVDVATAQTHRARGG